MKLLQEIDLIVIHPSYDPTLMDNLGLGRTLQLLLTGVLRHNQTTYRIKDRSSLISEDLYDKISDLFGL